VGGLAPTLALHALLVEVQRRVAHAAHVERDERLAGLERLLHVVGDRHRDTALDLEVAPALAAARAPEALLEPRSERLHVAWPQAERQPAVGDLAGQDHRLLRAGAEPDPRARLEVQDRLER